MDAAPDATCAHLELSTVHCLRPRHPKNAPFPAMTKTERPRRHEYRYAQLVLHSHGLVSSENKSKYIYESPSFLHCTVLHAIQTGAITRSQISQY